MDRTVHQLPPRLYLLIALLQIDSVPVLLLAYKQPHFL